MTQYEYCVFTLDKIIARVEEMRDYNNRPDGLREVWDTAYGHMLVIIEDERERVLRQASKDVIK